MDGRSCFRAILWFAAVVALAPLGCGGGETKEYCSVQGTVTFHGKPIDNGSILFQPTAGGPGVQVDIKSGHYQADRVPVGKARVEIQAYKETPGGGTPLTLIPANAPGNNQTVEIDQESKTMDFKVGQ